MTTTPFPGQPTPEGGFGIDPRLNAAALRAPTASREDYRSQAILKFHHPSMGLQGLPQTPSSIPHL